MMMVESKGNRVYRIIMEKWKDEPDHIDFTVGEYHLILLRGPLGALNGYVGVPEGHPAFGARYDDPVVYDISVHGGLTYAGCEVEHMKKELWYFGFDTAHGYDFVPGLWELPKLPKPPLPLEQLPEDIREMYKMEKMFEETMDMIDKMMPGLANDMNNASNYKDIDYVANEVKSLYQQLFDMEAEAGADKEALDRAITVRNRVQEES